MSLPLVYQPADEDCKKNDSTVQCVIFCCSLLVCEWKYRRLCAGMLMLEKICKFLQVAIKTTTTTAARGTGTPILDRDEVNRREV